MKKKEIMRIPRSTYILDTRRKGFLQDDGGTRYTVLRYTCPLSCPKHNNNIMALHAATATTTDDIPRRVQTTDEMAAETNTLYFPHIALMEFSSLQSFAFAGLGPFPVYI